MRHLLLALSIVALMVVAGCATKVEKIDFDKDLDNLGNDINRNDGPGDDLGDTGTIGNDIRSGSFGDEDILSEEELNELNSELNLDSGLDGETGLDLELNFE